MSEKEPTLPTPKTSNQTLQAIQRTALYREVRSEFDGLNRDALSFAAECDERANAICEILYRRTKVGSVPTEIDHHKDCVCSGGKRNLMSTLVDCSEPTRDSVCEQCKEPIETLQKRIVELEQEVENLVTAASQRAVLAAYIKRYGESSTEVGLLLAVWKQHQACTNPS